MTQKTLKTAIIGGGIAGLTCALALAKRGIDVCVYEQAPKLREVGAGLQLSPNAVKPLAKLGLMSALNTVACTPRSINIYDGHSTHELAQLPLGASIEKKFGAPYLLVHRAELQQILANACLREPKIKIQLNTKINDVPFWDGRPQIIDRFYDLIIAADGVHSRMRKQFFSVQSKNSHLVAWRTTIPMSQKPESFSKISTTLCLGPDAHLVAYPIASGTEYNCVAILPEDININDGFKKWNKQWATIFKATGEWAPWPLFTVPPLTNWVNGRIVLIGDAAHAMTPFAAQGSAMAIEDAFMLASALSSTLHIEAALDHWFTVRTKRVDAVSKLANKNRTLYHFPPAISAIRNFGMKILGSDRLLTRQDWVYTFDATQENLFNAVSG